MNWQFWPNSLESLKKMCADGNRNFAHYSNNATEQKSSLSGQAESLIKTVFS